MRSGLEQLLRHNPPEDVPASEDVCSASELQGYLDALREPPPSLIAGGDVMLGERATKTLDREGGDYAFAAIRPLLGRAPVVLGNLEGPFARRSPKEIRRYCYRVDPDLARSLRRAGINVLTLANNHVVDCGRAGVLETFDALADAGIDWIGAGTHEQAAHTAAILQAGPFRLGLLGYYWNRRCAATETLPGAAMGTAEALEADISGLRDQVDRIVVTFHWGVPYKREPSEEDRATARLAVECGADAVIGHHAHIIQPFEIYRGIPIFYSVGNFAFGTLNSRAEGLLVALRFEDTRTVVHAYPLYVKNRDPRVAHQPKALRGAAAEHALRRLREISGVTGASMDIEGGRGTLSVDREAHYSATAPSS